MGRAFEYRKARKFARWDKMSKTFTRIGREIAMSVKAGGPEPESNTRLRAAIQNAKAANMPKDRVEAAIKKAANKDEKAYEEVVYEGYAPHGIAVQALAGDPKEPLGFWCYNTDPKRKGLIPDESVDLNAAIHRDDVAIPKRGFARNPVDDLVIW